MSDDAWDSYLDEGETILWQGRPDQDFALVFEYPLAFVLTSVTAAFILLLGFAKRPLNAEDGAMTFILFMIFASLALLTLLSNTLRRRASWYTLTDRRAIVTMNPRVGMKKLLSYRITPEMVIDYRPESPASIYFGHEVIKTRDTSHTRRVGFERISDGQKVYRLMQDIQSKGAAT